MKIRFHRLPSGDYTATPVDAPSQPTVRVGKLPNGQWRGTFQGGAALIAATRQEAAAALLTEVLEGRAARGAESTAPDPLEEPHDLPFRVEKFIQHAPRGVYPWSTAASFATRQEAQGWVEAQPEPWLYAVRPAARA